MAEKKLNVAGVDTVQLLGFNDANLQLTLSVAFVDENGAVVNIADMRPLSEDSHCAARPARYALEMAKGWFAERGIRAGQRLRGLEKLKSR